MIQDSLSLSLSLSLSHSHSYTHTHTHTHTHTPFSLPPPLLPPLLFAVPSSLYMYLPPFHPPTSPPIAPVPFPHPGYRQPHSTNGRHKHPSEGLRCLDVGQSLRTRPGSRAERGFPPPSAHCPSQGTGRRTTCGY